MTRISTIITVCASAALFFLPLQPAMAATSKSSNNKKKSTTSTEGKKPDPGDADTSSGTSGTKKSAASNLDLPLPVKPPATSEKGASTEKKNPESTPAPAKTPEKSTAEPPVKREHAPNATVEPDAIAEFASQSSRIQQLMRDAIDLTRLNLTYTFGSADPDNGGMDCSGTIYYLLHAHGLKDVPRDSTGQYLWARKSGAFFPVVGKTAESEEFNELLPGDLMFWTGTYDSGRDIPISHVMMYLGREKSGGKRIMFGSSDGRSYNGVQRWGVSIFDFKMPKVDATPSEKPQAHFVGFARIPGLRSGMVAAETVAAVSTAGDAPKPATKSTSTSSSKKKGKSVKSE